MVLQNWNIPKPKCKHKNINICLYLMAKIYFIPNADANIFENMVHTLIMFVAKVGITWVVRGYKVGITWVCSGYSMGSSWVATGYAMGR